MALTYGHSRLMLRKHPLLAISRSLASASAPQRRNDDPQQEERSGFAEVLTRRISLFRPSPDPSISSSTPSYELPSYLSDVRDEAMKGYERLSGIYSRGAALYTRFADTSYGRLARMDKPIGTQLLFLPCAWGIALGASSPLEVVGLSTLVYGGALMARGAGCTINDIFDRDVDARVARTKDRPLASGELSIYRAIPFAVVQFIGGLGVLTMLSPTSFIIGTFSLIPIIYYPIAKRVYRYPQAILAFTFNTSALVGYAAVTNAVSVPALALYTSGVCWTMIYDTIYGHQDKVDDAKLGLNSTSLNFADTRKILNMFSIGQFGTLLAAGSMCDLGTSFYMGSAIAASRIYTQIYETDLNDPAACGDSFRSNAATGAIIWASILAGRVL